MILKMLKLLDYVKDEDNQEESNSDELELTINNIIYKSSTS